VTPHVTSADKFGTTRQVVLASLFDPSAIEALYQASQGWPRKINRAAHYALSAAASTKSRHISAEHFATAFDELT